MHAPIRLSALTVLCAPCLFNSSLFAGTASCCFQLNDYAVPGARRMTAEDLNGDGLPDLAVLTSTGGGTVLFNVGPGNFAGLMTYPPVSNSPNSIAGGDLDGDADVDLVVTSLNSVRVVPNDGTGDFLQPATYPLSSSPLSVAVADMDLDGDDDLVVLGRSLVTLGVEIIVLPNNGSGVFGAGTAVPVSGPLVSLIPLNHAMGDLDDDGDPDVVVPAPSGGVWVLLNDGGMLGAATFFGDGAGVPYLTVALGDVTGNGLEDIVLGTGLLNRVGLFVNAGGGTFTPNGTYETGPAAVVSVGVGDIDGDGWKDIIAAETSPLFASVSVLLNAGGGFASTGANFVCPLTEQTLWLVVEDIDADGKDDAIITTETGVAVLRSTCGPVGGTPADIDGDGMVGVNDLQQIISSWGLCNGCPADVDGDGVVGVGDLILLIEQWGPVG